MVLLKMSSDCSCLTINQIIAANIKLDMPVLSLAGCYVQKNKQVRWVDQTQYPMIVVASLSAVPQSCRTPLLVEETKKKFLVSDKTDSREKRKTGNR